MLYPADKPDFWAATAQYPRFVGAAAPFTFMSDLGMMKVSMMVWMQAFCLLGLLVTVKLL
jgi:hypothetical protein